MAISNYGLVALFLALVLYIFDFLYFDVSLITAILVLITCFIYLNRFKENLVFFLTFILITSYPVVFILAKFLEAPYHYLLDFQIEGYESILFNTMLVFLVIVFDSKKKLKINYNYNNNKLVSNFFGLLAILLILAGVLIAWPPVILGYNINSGSSQLFEYSFILAVLNVFLSSPDLKKGLKNKTNLIFVIMVLLGFLAPLLFGRRGPSLMYFWLFTFVLSLTYKSSFKIILLLVLSIIIFRVFGVLRAGIDINLISLMLGALPGEPMANHQGGVMVSSVTYIGLVEEQVWDWYIRLSMFLGAILSGIPYAIHPFPEVFIHIFVKDYAQIPGSGGFPFVYAYVWLDYFGVIAISLLLRKIIWSSGSFPLC